MAQVHFTLEYDFLVGLFSENHEKAFGKLMEQIMNQLIQAESSEILGAERHERKDTRTDYRNGERDRSLTTRIGALTLTIPRHRNEPFKPCFLEAYKRNEKALLSTMIEMVIQGVSTRKIEKITQELCGQSFSKSTVSEICKQLDPVVKEFKERPLDTNYPFVLVDATYIKVREDHKIKNKAFFIAMGINLQGYKEILGFGIYDSETARTWEEFLKGLKTRGLENTDLFISDNHAGLKAALVKTYPGISWQRCQVHFRRNIIEQAPKKYQAAINDALTELFNLDSLKEAEKKKTEIIKEYEDVAANAMETLDNGFYEVMTVISLPKKYRVILRSTNILERENEELKRRVRVLRIFPNCDSVIRLLGAVLLDHHEGWMHKQRTMNMSEYNESRGVIVMQLPKIEVAA